MSQNRDDYTLLGRRIGTASGWDQMDHLVIFLYDFKPASGVELPQGDVNFDLANGVAQQFDDDGQITFEVDLITAIAKAPRDAEEKLPAE